MLISMTLILMKKHANS